MIILFAAHLVTSQYHQRNNKQMSDKMQKDAMQKIYDIMNTHPAYTPYEHPNHLANQNYPHLEHNLNDKNKHYNPYDIYQQSLYLPTNVYSSSNLPIKTNFSGDSNISHHFPTSGMMRPQSGSNDLANPPPMPSSMYQLAMQQNAPFPYRYPHYGYPSMPYPYSMYPPYMNRPMDIYPPPSELSAQGYHHAFPGIVPFSGPQTQHSSAIKPHINYAIKQQIVISSDEQREKRQPALSLERSEKALDKSIKPEPKKTITKEQNSEAMPLKNASVSVELRKEEQSIRKQADEPNPFYIKHKKIAKEDKVQPKNQGKQQKRKQKNPPELNTTHKQKDIDKNKDIAKNGKGIESKQLLSPQQSEPKQQIPQQGENKDKNAPLGLVADDKENKKQKLKDDHPLKELRYNQSHGKIRIGVIYQSQIPDILNNQKAAVMRKNLQLRLQQREIAAITF